MPDLTQQSAPVSELRALGIRPTRQRTQIATAIRAGGNRHLTAEGLHREMMQSGARVSLATVYNTLHEFTSAGFLRRVEVGERTWFCTNGAEHHHFYDETTGRLEDIAGAQPRLCDLPQAPEGMEIVAVDVVVRVRPRRT